jgi:hypothetical protein
VDLVYEPDGACANGEGIGVSTAERDPLDYAPRAGVELEQLLVVDGAVAGSAVQHPDFAVADGDPRVRSEP